MSVGRKPNRGYANGTVWNCGPIFINQLKQNRTMMIILKGVNNAGTINTGDATADECMEACVAAMLAEGYNVYNIANAIRAMARKMDDAAKKDV